MKLSRRASSKQVSEPAPLSTSRTLFWRAPDALDYSLTQAQLWLADVMYDPEAGKQPDR